MTMITVDMDMDLAMDVGLGNDDDHGDGADDDDADLDDAMMWAGCGPGGPFASVCVWRCRAAAKVGVRRVPEHN